MYYIYAKLNSGQDTVSGFKGYFSLLSHEEIYSKEEFLKLVESLSSESLSPPETVDGLVEKCGFQRVEHMKAIFASPNININFEVNEMVGSQSSATPPENAK